MKNHAPLITRFALFALTGLNTLPAYSYINEDPLPGMDSLSFEGDTATSTPSYTPPYDANFCREKLADLSKGSHFIGCYTYLSPEEQNQAIANLMGDEAQIVLKSETIYDPVQKRLLRQRILVSGDPVAYEWLWKNYYEVLARGKRTQAWRK